MNYIVETKHLKKYYQMGDTTVKALDGIDFCVKDQEFIAIIGKSGSGKSTLLHMLGGLDTPTEGEVLIEGKSILKLKKRTVGDLSQKKKLDSFFKIIIWFQILTCMRMLFSQWNLMEEKLTQNM